MGVTSFTKYTRELVNASPMEFLKQCRLNHAAKQLRQRPNISITEVCFSNGFNSSQYFATCFRKQFKMSQGNLYRSSVKSCYMSASSPQLAVEGAVLNSFGDVVAEDVFGAGEVGDGSGDF